MTKEEILLKHFNYGFTGMEQYAIFKSMDDYAKQEAIAFAKFAMENTFQDMNVLGLEGLPDKWEYDGRDGWTQSLTTEQLYSLFLEQK